MGLAPAPGFPERPGTNYEVSQSPGTPNGGGPLYFEEGLGTDTDIPNDFQVGAMQGYATPPGRTNHNQNVYIKDAAQRRCSSVRTSAPLPGWRLRPT